MHSLRSKSDTRSDETKINLHKYKCHGARFWCYLYWDTPDNCRQLQSGLSLRRERSLSLASAHALNAPGERLTARLKMLSSEYSDHEYITQPALRHHGNKPFMKAMCCPHCPWSGCRIYSTIKCLPAFKLIKIWSYLDIYPPSPFVCIDMSYGRTHHLHMSGYSLPSALF